MPRPALPVARAARSAVFAAVLTVTAVLAHRLAHGMTPDAPTIAAGALGAVVLGWYAVPRRAWVLAAAAAGGQLALHTTYALRMAHGGGLLPTMLCGTHHAGTAPGVAAVHLAGPATWHPGLMLPAHLVAAVVAVLGLRAVDVLAALLARLLRVPLLVVGVGRPRPYPRVVALPVLPRLPSIDLLAAAPRRGPPASSCA